MRVAAFTSVVVSVLVAGSGCGGDPADVSSSTSAEPPTTFPSTPNPPTTAPTTTPPPAAIDGVLFDFADPGSVSGWSTQNDTVMGGVSSASVGWADSAMVFAGELSLANNGGFTSAVSPPDPGIAERADGGNAVVLRGAGDGRTYLLQLRGGPDGQRRWTRPFTLPDGGGEVTLPFGGFEATDFMLDPVTPEPVDPSTLVAVAFYLVDKQEGPFRLSVSSVAVRTG